MSKPNYNVLSIYLRCYSTSLQLMLFVVVYNDIMVVYKIVQSMYMLSTSFPTNAVVYV